MLVAPAPELVDVHPKFLSHRLQRSTALLSQRHRFGLELRHEPASRPGHWSPSGWNRSTLETRPFRRGKLTDNLADRWRHSGEGPVEGGAVDLEHPRHLARGGPLLEQAPRQRDLVRAQLGRAAETDAALLGSHAPCPGAFLDQRPLELGD